MRKNPTPGNYNKKISCSWKIKQTSLFPWPLREKQHHTCKLVSSCRQGSHSVGVAEGSWQTCSRCQDVWSWWSVLTGFSKDCTWSRNPTRKERKTKQFRLCCSQNKHRYKSKQVLLVLAMIMCSLGMLCKLTLMKNGWQAMLPISVAPPKTTAAYITGSLKMVMHTILSVSPCKCVQSAHVYSNWTRLTLSWCVPTKFLRKWMYLAENSKTVALSVFSDIPGTNCRIRSHASLIRALLKTKTEIHDSSFQYCIKWYDNGNNKTFTVPHLWLEKVL